MFKGRWVATTKNNAHDYNTPQNLFKLLPFFTKVKKSFEYIFRQIIISKRNSKVACNDW